MFNINTNLEANTFSVKFITYPIEPELSKEGNFKNSITIYCENGHSPEESKNKANDIISRVKKELRTLCFTADDYKIGMKDEYLSSIVSCDNIAKLKPGDSALIFAPTGTGKTKVIQDIIDANTEKIKVIYLTNRIACKVQFKSEMLDKKGYHNIPPNAFDIIHLDDNLDIMTYQEFALKLAKYRNKEMLIILDESHSLAEDSVFSDYGQKIVSFLKHNLNNTIRIYITATEDYILDIIMDIEKLLSLYTFPETIDEDTPVNTIYGMEGNKFSRIKQVYLIDLFNNLAKAITI